MAARRFAQVDVFGSTALGGNPVAVIVDGEDLHDEELAALARWTNLSETTVLLAPTDPAADYRLRIFTPGGELPFAGHPTLGSAHAWLEAGGVPRTPGTLVQECGIGLVTLRSDESGLAFAAPELLREGPVAEDDLLAIARSLRIERSEILAHSWVDNGPGWVAVQLRDAGAVLALEPDFAAMRPFKLGVVGAHPAGSECAFEVRAFVPGLGVPEDPVTGSLNAGVARWLIGAGIAPPAYLAAQGTALGRSGRVVVSTIGTDIWIGGSTRTVFSGTATL